jgi:hypothetical protein
MATTPTGFFWGRDPNVNQMMRQRIALQLMQNQNNPSFSPPADSAPAAAADDEPDFSGLFDMSPQQQSAGPPPQTAVATAEQPPVSAPGPSSVAAASAGSGDIWDARSHAIAGIESGGERNPYATISAPTRGDRAYGKYQIMGANIPDWTEAATGTALTPQQFLASPDAQEATFRHRFGTYVDRYGDEGAARAWFGGERGMRNLGATDVYGRLNVGQYGQDYLRRLGRGR